MGVHGLWTIVQPCARPVKLETLNRKRLAVDASIWIYQFLKAVRDKEGNALRNSHIVGFFRRICKLLYFGIKPVFVFDGGAPILKRQTIAGRKKRREGRREDAVRTAGKLLAVQLQRTAEQEASKRKKQISTEEKDEVLDNPVYVDEIFMTEKQKQQSRTFRKKDAYHLPDLQVSLEDMGAPNDPRIMSREELEEYARQFHQGEDINLYDFSNIDFDSPFFLSLPATDRYNILNAARLRSRLRMGYSKEQLDNMFPDRMAFSKFQIERVKERNDLTQRLMNINGMNGVEAFYNSGQRIAGERGKEYVLVQDNAVEGGWVLGVVGNKEGRHEDKPIDVDQYFRHEIPSENEEATDDEGGFEDVPIEGLNRLPKLRILQPGVLDNSIRQQALTAAESQRQHELVEHEEDSLFVQDYGSGVAHLEGHQRFDHLFSDNGENEDDDLQKAIEMSLQSSDNTDQHDHEMPDIPVNRNVPLSPSPKETILNVNESDDDEFDFATAVAQSKRVNKGPKSIEAPRPIYNHPFDGPLPFESIKLKKTPASKNPSTDETHDPDAGGFDKQPEKTSKAAVPLPPWFSAERPGSSDFISDGAEDNLPPEYRNNSTGLNQSILKTRRSLEVIDVDQLPESKDVIDLEVPSNDSPKAPRHFHVDEEKVEGHRLFPNLPFKSAEVSKSLEEGRKSDSEAYEWGDSDDEGPSIGYQDQTSRTKPSPSPSPEFEDVTIEPLEKATSPSAPQIWAEASQTVDFVEEGEFSDPEDEELLRQLAAEGEEHARFAATLNPKVQGDNFFDYEQELKQLRLQQKKDRRDADEVSQVMITECQQLLTLFGLPYITAPMEAEAQCAKLVSLGLVDGIITDDSDVFLFGGTRVYKNMFNQSKFVECYLASDLEKEYALYRQKLIRFAHLLGSDYTDGISGVGPVTALEILTEFSSLEEFRDWWTQVQSGTNVSDGTHAAFYKKFKKQATKIFLPPSFPDPRVDKAYLEPEADSDPSPFQWGVPDLHGLRNFLMTTIGWSQERTDEVLVPVIRDMNSREQEGTQSNITSFFSGSQGAGAFAPRVRSGGRSRMEKAFNRLRQEAVAETQQSLGTGDSGETGPAESSGLSPSSNPSRHKGRGNKRGASEVGIEQEGGKARGGASVTSKKQKSRQNLK